MSRTTGNSNDSLMASYSQRTHKIIDRQQSGLNGRRTPDFRRVGAAAAADVERRTWRTAKTRNVPERKPALTGNETESSNSSAVTMVIISLPILAGLASRKRFKFPQSLTETFGDPSTAELHKYPHISAVERWKLDTRIKDGRMG
ncbi:hypothetical protein EVAR_80590_1 [Eumeta japonica]|uniref:Uncharacterized protein n=1 Tax=Eumeta variegata TaxID=151549 RepID=A0A4C1TLG0_EUMVA|nr:hypothetical protein EVAR_80590_1 [Eumeta japonica]